jgi:hypothetical protein
MGGPFWVTPNECGQAVVPNKNCGPYKTILRKNELVGILENINNSKAQEINPDFINALAQSQALRAPPLTPEKRKFIAKTVQLTVPRI